MRRSPRAPIAAILVAVAVLAGGLAVVNMSSALRRAEAALAASSPDAAKETADVERGRAASGAQGGQALAPRLDPRASGLVVVLALLAGALAWGAVRRGEGLRERAEHESGRLRAAHGELAAQEHRCRQLEEQLSQMVVRDPVTGLAHRRALLQRLAQAQARARLAPGYTLAVLCLALERFGIIAETLGPVAAEELTQAVARRLEEAMRPEDELALLSEGKYGAVLFDIASEEDALATATRIEGALALPFEIAGQEVFCPARIGIEVSSSGYDRAEDLLQAAELALAHALREPERRVARYAAEMHERTARRMQLEDDLRYAIERGETRVYLQPLVGLADGRISGFEALVRWQHPREGLLAPGRFIETAEESGLIVALDAWVLTEACRLAAAWPGADDLTVAVNLSARHLAHPDLVHHVASALAASGLPPRRLTLEITESLLVSDFAAAQAVCAALHDLGASLALDDFGTGYSSLSYLTALPIDYLKVDRSFVMSLDRDPGAEKIVRAVGQLAGELGLATVAEGVETAEHAARVRNLGYTAAQGYYFARPLEAEAAAGLIATTPVFDVGQGGILTPALTG